MISKELNEILSAEKQAAEKVNLADKESAQIIADAHSKAKDIIDRAKQESKEEAESLFQRNEILINEILDNSNKKSHIDSEKIRAGAQAKKEEAIDMVIKKIISI